MKYLFAVAIALGLAFAAYGAAANFPSGVNGGTLQYGEDNIIQCARFANVDGWGADADTGQTTYVRIVYGPDPAPCDGVDIFVRVTSNGTVIESLSGTLDGSGTIQLPFAAPHDNEDVTDIHILFEGPGGIPSQP